MSHTQDKWNQRYQNKPLQPPEPPPFITEVRARLRPGRALDLASGDGAVALYLAAQGFEVTALDIAEAALARLSTFARQRQLPVETCCLDLSDPVALSELGKFDTLTICRYKPAATLWPALARLLVEDGTLAICSFNLRQHEATGFNPDFCLAPGELVDIDPRLALIEYASSERNGSFMDEYLFRRR